MVFTTAVVENFETVLKAYKEAVERANREQTVEAKVAACAAQKAVKDAAALMVKML